jgi:hypothetical protein
MIYAGQPTREPDYQSLHVDQVGAKLQQTCNHLRVKMRWSQAVQEDRTNTEGILALNIQVGSMVWLDAQNIRTT